MFDGNGQISMVSIVVALYAIVFLLLLAKGFVGEYLRKRKLMVPNAIMLAGKFLVLTIAGAALWYKFSFATKIVSGENNMPRVENFEIFVAFATVVPLLVIGILLLKWVSKSRGWK